MVRLLQRVWFQTLIASVLIRYSRDRQFELVSLARQLLDVGVPVRPNLLLGPIEEFLRCQRITTTDIEGGRNNHQSSVVILLSEQ